MKKGIVLLLFVLIGMLILSGCSKDEETKVVSTVCPKLLATAWVGMYPELDFEVDFQALSYPTLHVDSVIFTDRKCEPHESYWWLYGDDAYEWFEYYVENDSLRYDPGDTVEVKIYSNGTTITSRLPLLGYYEDTIVYIVPNRYDTVTFGQSIALVWNKVARAEWYGIAYYYYYDSSGTSSYRYGYVATKDTAYTIPGLSNTFEGYYNIYVISVTGPYPGVDAFNISGRDVVGTFFSNSAGAPVRVYVIPAGSAPGVLPPDDNFTEPTGLEILKILSGRMNPPERSTIEIVPPSGG